MRGWSDPIVRTIDERTALALADVAQRREVTFVTGYCKGPEAIMHEFDRGDFEVINARAAWLDPRLNLRVFHQGSGRCEGQ